MTDETKSERNELGRWLPGVSGNPNGQPPLTDERRTVRELAQDKTQEAFEELCGLMKHPKTTQRTKLACIREIFNRGWGKPTETIIAERLPFGTSVVSEMDLAREVAFMLSSGLEHQRELEHLPLSSPAASGSQLES